MRSKRKFNKTREWVIEEYVVKNRPRKDVAKECGLTIGGFKSYLIEQKIVKDKNDITKESLEEQINKDKTITEISNFFKCSKSKIRNYCKKYNLKIKVHEVYEQYDDTNDLIIVDMYNKGCSSTEIGNYLGVTHCTVLKHLKKCGVKRRTLSESQWNYNGKTIHSDLLNYDIMYDLYINQRLSKKDLSEKYNCSAHVIDGFLKKLNISIRGTSESKIGQMVGDKHPNWQGGICELDYRLRTYTKVNLNKEILKRDYYKCQLCGSKKKLHVHHIKPFNEIVKEICNEHKDLDVIKNINELYNIITKDKRFTDLNNLITYCEECHFYKIHGYEKSDK